MFALCHIAIHTVKLDEVPSTNDYATSLIAKSNPIEGTVISTYNQTGGKGQIGRSWFSDINKNLSFSLILRPRSLAVADGFNLSMILSLALREALQELTEIPINIKWPNDLIINDKKIAGMLIQQNVFKDSVSTTVLGVGINVNQSVFPEELPNPISLLQISGREYNLDLLLLRIVEKILLRYQERQSQDFISLRLEYLKYLYRRGESSQFMAKGEQFTGEIVGIESSGKLLINRENRLCKYALSEVKMVF